MFLERVLSPVYLDIVYDNYEMGFLKSIDEENFFKIYNLLKSYGFYYIDDIIINYLELFELDFDRVDRAIKIIKTTLGEDYIKIIGSNLTIIDDIINLASI